MTGWALVVLSALWLPVNNYVLEGPVLVSFGQSHGVTVSDLFGVAGFLVGAALVLRRAAQDGYGGTRTLASAAGCILIFAGGAVIAFLTG